MQGTTYVYFSIYRPLHGRKDQWSPKLVPQLAANDLPSYVRLIMALSFETLFDLDMLSVEVLIDGSRPPRSVLTSTPVVTLVNVCFSQRSGFSARRWASRLRAHPATRLPKRAMVVAQAPQAVRALEKTLCALAVRIVGLATARESAKIVSYPGILLVNAASHSTKARRRQTSLKLRRSNRHFSWLSILSSCGSMLSRNSRTFFLH